MKNIVGRREFVLRILERADMGGFGTRKLAPALHRRPFFGFGALGNVNQLYRIV